MTNRLRIHKPSNAKFLKTIYLGAKPERWESRSPFLELENQRPVSMKCDKHHLSLVLEDLFDGIAFMFRFNDRMSWETLSVAKKQNRTFKALGFPVSEIFGELSFRFNLDFEEFLISEVETFDIDRTIQRANDFAKLNGFPFAFGEPHCADANYVRLVWLTKEESVQDYHWKTKSETQKVYENLGWKWRDDEFEPDNPFRPEAESASMLKSS